MENEQEILPSLSKTQDPAEQLKGLLSGIGAQGQLPEGILSAVSNPELMAKLPQVMALLKPMLGEASSPAPAKPATHEEERERLLLSLRPFLSKERRELLESILKLSKLGELLKQLS